MIEAEIAGAPVPGAGEGARGFVGIAFRQQNDGITYGTLERMVFSTGSWRGDVRLLFLDGEPSAPGLDAEDLAGCWREGAGKCFWIDDVKTTAK